VGSGIPVRARAEEPHLGGHASLGKEDLVLEQGFREVEHLRHSLP
jgi:hypothetical protein